MDLWVVPIYSITASWAVVEYFPYHLVSLYIFKVACEKEQDQIFNMNNIRLAYSCGIISASASPTQIRKAAFWKFQLELPYPKSRRFLPPLTAL